MTHFEESKKKNIGANPKSEIDTKALNEKLALFCGFKRMLVQEWDQHNSKVLRWITPNNIKTSLLPLLYCSLDQQVKWIVPKLQSKGYYTVITICEHKGSYVYIKSVITETTGIKVENDNPALAFALAVEKIIQQDEKDDIK